MDTSSHRKKLALTFVLVFGSCFGSVPVERLSTSTTDELSNEFSNRNR